MVVLVVPPGAPSIGGIVELLAAGVDDGIELIDGAAPFDAMVPIAAVVPPVVAVGLDDIWEFPTLADPIADISAAPPAPLVAAPGDDIDDIDGAWVLLDLPIAAISASLMPIPLPSV
jgi:hypothetical protein